MVPTSEEIASAVERAKLLNNGRRFWHRHRYAEFFYDIRADVPNGPRSYHGIGWACSCGHVEYASQA